MLPLDYGTLRRQVEAVAPALDDVRVPQLVHWDLWDGNIFVEPKTGQITGIIDFERALWGDPLMEFQYRTLEITPAYESGYGAIAAGLPHGARPPNTLQPIPLSDHGRRVFLPLTTRPTTRSGGRANNSPPT